MKKPALCYWSLPLYPINPVTVVFLLKELFVGGGIYGLDESGTSPVLQHAASAVVVVVVALLLCLLQGEAPGQTVIDVVVLSLDDPCAAG